MNDTRTDTHSTTIIPVDGKCRGCGASIAWGESKNGKPMPLDPNTGKTHFAVCTNKQRAKEGKSYQPENVCIKCGSYNVTRLPGTAMHHGAVQCHDCRTHRWLAKPS